MMKLFYIHSVVAGTERERADRAEQREVGELEVWAYVRQQ
jgi:hypothetical protein